MATLALWPQTPDSSSTLLMSLSLWVPSRTMGGRNDPHFINEETEACELTSCKAWIPNSLRSAAMMGSPRPGALFPLVDRVFLLAWGLPQGHIVPGEGVTLCLSTLSLGPRNAGWGARSTLGLQACGALFQDWVLSRLPPVSSAA